MNDIRVAVIGGGYAGMSAAVELARTDINLTVFEAATSLGGRARFIEAAGRELSNGPHILLGSNTETLSLLRFLHISPKIFQPEPFVINTPGRIRLQLPALPAPFHLISGLLQARGLGWADRLAAFHLVKYLRKQRYALRKDRTVSQLLSDTNQTPLLRELLWEPICLAALSTPAEHASAQMFADLLQTWLSTNASSEQLIPRVDMSELLPIPAARYLSRRGNPVRTASRINRIRLEAGRFYLDSNETEASHFSHVILATQPDSASRLLAEFEALTLLREQLGNIKFEAIATIYLAYGEQLSLPEYVVQVSGSVVRSLFDYGRTRGQTGLIAGVIRGREDLSKIPNEALVLEVHKAVEQIFPRLAPPQWSKVIVEDQAAFSCTPGLVRPRTITPVRNLLLAGDYIESPYPASIESAVRSGLAAARHIRRSVQAN